MEYINHGVIRGVLTKPAIGVKENIATFMVKIEKKGRNNRLLPMYPTFVAYDELAERIKQVPVNSVIEVNYRLETRRKTVNGKYVYYENNVVTDIKVVE